MSSVIKQVKIGQLSAYKAAKIYNLAKTTILDKVHGRVLVTAKPGPTPRLTTSEEDRLVKWVLDMAESSYPVTSQELAMTIKCIINADNRKVVVRIIYQAELGRCIS